MRKAKCTPNARNCKWEQSVEEGAWFGFLHMPSTQGIWIWFKQKENQISLFASAAAAAALTRWATDNQATAMCENF